MGHTSHEIGTNAFAYTNIKPRFDVIEYSSAEGIPVVFENLFQVKKEVGIFYIYRSKRQ